MQSLQNAVQTQFWAVRDYLAPVLKDSKFKEHGRITPQEFVAAGDFLVYKFPTWEWEGGDKSMQRNYLPADKQYLVQRSVPCIRRVAQLQNYHDGEGEEEKEQLLNFKADELLGDANEDEDDQWVATHISSKEGRRGIHDAEEIPDIPDSHDHSAETGLEGKVSGLHLQDSSNNDAAVPNVDDIPDIDDDDYDDLAGAGVTEPEDAAAATGSSHAQATTDAQGNTLSVRTYDCYITYDKFYQTPRLWLSGLSPSRQPLTKDDVFQDVAADYAQKTVTFEPFPHKDNTYMASVHPCKHANVMKKVIERMNTAVREAQLRQAAAEGGVSPATQDASEAAAKEKKKKGWGITSAVKKAAGVGGSSSTTAPTSTTESDDVEGLRVDQYLLVFLKFMSNVVPTIELDATMAL
ncbi:hypothetical protein P389DRAFT_8663 [Cystobasidium minutum MCA 4210]|uniref:uncharacterized protein n=1 Tax=Cystobasidium minutum MCA 4210 TaxID=1397322 RepID=UPI0034CECFAA|eukprot:jgi/Rhomi1/8663/CE8662_998